MAPETGAALLRRALPDVSRETCDRLAAYAAVLAKWQKSINLVGPRTLEEVWTRHFLDSAQLRALIPAEARVLVDLGSGAGFPGLVLAILGIAEVHLIESDTRKAAFLREAARATGTSVTVHARRIEEVAPFEVDIVTARALAPLVELLPLAERFVGPRTLCLFPKGQNVDAELTEATKAWKMQVERLASLSDPRASVLRLSGIVRA
ncbi:16S rRNA (guanine(527)-N(7))-methyltransferase RsmG [Arenibaculum pallidiluteum]|uniref:16S rRNA (guanine(527)-N(7))-methyltransferase RsmG n=1 Tax=Arenibaculum pallidiluteum TaxID=2812559 RepID=UPI0038B3E04E